MLSTSIDTSPFAGKSRQTPALWRLPHQPVIQTHRFLYKNELHFAGKKHGGGPWVRRLLLLGAMALSGCGGSPLPLPIKPSEALPSGMNFTILAPKGTVLTPMQETACRDVIPKAETLIRDKYKDRPLSRFELKCVVNPRISNPREQVHAGIYSANFSADLADLKEYFDNLKVELADLKDKVLFWKR
ncbi:MAG TPA: hypothetical protein V6C52_15125 [Coleofasciculaceae cyanobacterium]